MLPTVRPPTAAIIFLAIVLAFSSADAQTRESSVVFLPAHVDAPPGEVTLYADYGSVRTDGRIPVYLVNRGPKSLDLRGQDGDIYVKLEFQDADGAWIRAQPHYYSWCGNSYYTFDLEPENFIRILAYQPINGTGARVRYSFYGQSLELSSNAGQGVVADLDLQRAAHDAMTARHGTFEQVAAIALSPAGDDPWMQGWGNNRALAVQILGSGKFDDERSSEVLLQVRESNPDLGTFVDRALEAIAERLLSEDCC